MMDHTLSIAYLANSMPDAEFKHKEPWLHCRILGNPKTAEFWQIVYVWDTREVVEVVKQTKRHHYNEGMKHYKKAFDNGQPLKDPKGLIPEFARNQLTRRGIGITTDKGLPEPPAWR